MQGEEQRGTLGTVRNATSLLSLLAEGPAYNQLTDLAERSGMSLPTVHRLLRSLALAGLVEQDPRSLRYSLGPEIVRLSERYLDRLPTLRALSPYLRDLRDTTKTTILVAVLVRTSILYVDRVDGEEGAGVFREAHRVHAALDTAAGRLLLARGGPEAWAEAVGAGSPAGSSTPRSTASTGTCRSGPTGWPSTGRARRATDARLPTAPSTPRWSRSPRPSGASPSGPVTGSRSTWAGSPRPWW